MSEEHVRHGTSLGELARLFLKLGTIGFGGPAAHTALMEDEVVRRRGWLTREAFLDYLGATNLIPGAVLATLGIFLPAFVFVAVSGPLIPRLRRSRVAGAALDGVNAASLGLMAVVTWQLGRASIVSVSSCIVALIAGVLLATQRVNAAWLVVAGAIIGIALGM